MAEYRLLKLLDGLGNGLDAPDHWKGGQEQEFRHPDGGTEVYIQRQYFRDRDLYYVWVRKELGFDAFCAVMFWHFEMYRGSQVAAQKELLHTSMTSAMQYTNIIMAVGYAAMFTIWSQTKEDFTAATTLTAGILLALSVLLFVGWEISQMIYRALMNYKIANAVGDIDLFAERMRAAQDLQQAFTRRSYLPWIAVLSATIALALAAFVIMLSGLLHGAWLAFLTDSIAQVKG